jgi:hypothetical protein
LCSSLLCPSNGLIQRRGGCCNAELIQKEVALGEESPLRFFLAPIARKSPTELVGCSASGVTRATVRLTRMLGRWMPTFTAGP